MIAVFITLHPLVRDSELAGQTDPLVALRTRGDAQRGPRIATSIDTVDAVTIRTDRRLRNASRDRLSVHALVVLRRDRRVTRAARPRNIESEDG